MIRWTQRIKKEVVLRWAGEKIKIKSTLGRRKVRFIVHTWRHSSLLKTILKVKISGKTTGEDLGWNILGK
jgi:hypothetical protein